ncbi:hypothetical protein [Amycolatopsis sp. NPDC021455]|uniref:hypothetical protein n=1 Tax=Amycolatopsis sp. NPDC021455 TaxID=3154901 RepID=UPI00340494A0
MANVLADGVKLFDKVPDKVTAMILEARKEHGRPPLQEFVVKTAVKSVWTYVKGLSVFGWVIQDRNFLPVIRVLAVLICKAPERHRVVVEYCLDPLKDS